jgi:hypothetical protein
MAFEEVSTAGFKTYLTRYGVSRLLDPKSNFDIKYFSLTDEGINYDQTVDSSVLVSSVNGEDLKTLYNGGEVLDFVGNEKDGETSEITISKSDIVFVNDCDNLEYKNLDVTVYLGNYLQNLREVNNNIENTSREYEPFIKLYDFVNVYEYTENAFGEYRLWDTKNYNLNYVFETDRDYNNYKTFVNTFVSKNDGRTTVNYDSNRFKSPFQLTIGSYKSNSTNTVTQNGGLTIQLYPVNNILYRTDSTSVQIQNLNENSYQTNKNIIPSVNFNGINHNIKMDRNIVYRDNVNIPIFRFNNLLESGITAAKNMFEFYGTDSASDSNTKVITINMDVMVNDDTFKPRPAKLKLNLTLDLDESNWNGSSDFTKIN